MEASSANVGEGPVAKQEQEGIRKLYRIFAFQILAVGNLVLTPSLHPTCKNKTTGILFKYFPHCFLIKIIPSVCFTD